MGGSEKLHLQRYKISGVESRGRGRDLITPVWAFKIGVSLSPLFTPKSSMAWQQTLKPEPYTRLLI